MYDVSEATSILIDVRIPSLFQHNVDVARRRLIAADDEPSKAERTRHLNIALSALQDVLKIKVIGRNYPGEADKVKRAKEMIEEYISLERTYEKGGFDALERREKKSMKAKIRIDKAYEMAGGKTRFRF